MSVSFSAVYGTRVESLDDPLLVEFNRIWDVGMKCTEILGTRINFLC